MWKRYCCVCYLSRSTYCAVRHRQQPLFFVLFFPFSTSAFSRRYQENLKVHAIRVMAVIEKTMHRLNDEKRAGLVSVADRLKAKQRPKPDLFWMTLIFKRPSMYVLPSPNDVISGRRADKKWQTDRQTDRRKKRKGIYSAILKHKESYLSLLQKLFFAEFSVIDSHREVSFFCFCFVFLHMFLYRSHFCGRGFKKRFKEMRPPPLFKQVVVQDTALNSKQTYLYFAHPTAYLFVRPRATNLIADHVQDF